MLARELARNRRREGHAQTGSIQIGVVQIYTLFSGDGLRDGAGGAIASAPGSLPARPSLQMQADR